MRTLEFRAIAALLAAVGTLACSDGAGGGPEAGPACADGRPSYASTFDAVQQRVFEGNGCTQDICHGSAAQGGLDLRAGAAYANLVDRRSSGGALARVERGDEERSSLWLKLVAKTRPDAVTVFGSPMPIGLDPVSEEDLELLRLWIYAGAPETGVATGTQQLLDACLPDAEPIAIPPLPSPAPGTGIQLRMPEWSLPANSEFEGCMATYYDVGDQVPAEYLDATGLQFAFGASEVRQDPMSHHIFVYYPTGNFSPEGVDVRDPAFGAWTCRGGSAAGSACDPKAPGECAAGGGLCASEMKRAFACIGFGPSSAGLTVLIGGSGTPVSRSDYPAGVFAQLPTRGVIYWDPHAFNLTKTDGVMHASLNYEFTGDRRYALTGLADFSAIFRPNAPPFTRETYCNDSVVPRGARLFNLSTHTHKHGKHTWVTLADGTQIYENFSYTDPVQQRFDPPLPFDSADPAERTLRYCATFENGLLPDGRPDPETVTRLSKVRKATGGLFGGACHPVACAEGRVGEPCDGEGDDRTCDSAPGANDGSCDACPLVGGESTENEMFNLFGLYWVEPPGSVP